MTDPKPYAKTIICLANSRRPDGRCFAGKEFAKGALGAWIRRINAANQNAISEKYRHRYWDGRARREKPEALDFGASDPFNAG